jgi:hypothetical protein
MGRSIILSAWGIKIQNLFYYFQILIILKNIFLYRTLGPKSGTLRLGLRPRSDYVSDPGLLFYRVLSLLSYIERKNMYTSFYRIFGQTMNNSLCM